MTPNYLWLLDAGHGGIDDKGRYTTAPSKMHVFDDGFTIYEGQINRAIQNLLTIKMKHAELLYKIIQDPISDTPLFNRVFRANLEHAKGNKCIYISIHSNAGGGQGNEVYTSVGKTKSDLLVPFFANSYRIFLPRMKFRQDVSDGDADKEAKFYVLEKTKCPAILVENGFMDNREEAEILKSEAGQEKYAAALFNAIMNIEINKPV